MFQHVGDCDLDACKGDSVLKAKPPDAGSLATRFALRFAHQRDSLRGGQLATRSDFQGDLV